MEPKYVMITSGAYSDYCVYAVMLWTSEAKTPEEAIAEFKAASPPNKQDHWRLAAFLATKGYAKDINGQEIYCGENWENDDPYFTTQDVTPRERDSR